MLWWGIGGAVLGAVAGAAIARATCPRDGKVERKPTTPRLPSQPDRQSRWKAALTAGLGAAADSLVGPVAELPAEDYELIGGPERPERVRDAVPTHE